MQCLIWFCFVAVCSCIEVVDFGIEWHIPVGCGFSGFYVEFLGVSSFLVEALPELRVTSGPCSHEFYDMLFQKESNNFRRIYDPDWAQGEGFEQNSRLPIACKNNNMAKEHSDQLTNVDLPGGDLPRYRNGIVVKNTNECDCYCLSRKSCVGWTFRDKDSKCWLKSHLHAPIMNIKGLTSKIMPSSLIPNPRIDVWHGRCEVEEIRKAQQDGAYVVGRLMTESNLFRNTPGVLECAQVVDEIWVPSLFHSQLFKNSGIRSDVVFVIPEAVDSTLFSTENALLEQKEETSDGSTTTKKNDINFHHSHQTEFVFLSVFKWERRKGYDLLLDAYWQTFSVSENVVLKLRCWKPSWEHGTQDIDKQITDYAASKRRRIPHDVRDGHKQFLSRSELAKVEWIGSIENPYAEELTRSDMLQLYHDADCFVLATRGEGWGLPAAEAMTMGIPTVVTNWSGPSEFATDETAYLIPVQKWDRAGFAILDIDIIGKLLRMAYTDSESHIDSSDAKTIASLKGIAARKHMTTKFSPDVVGMMIVDRLSAIGDAIKRQQSQHRGDDEL